MTGTRHIHILEPAVARKIAAGEVIERPQSVVRELLDNSLDAGATAIDVHLEAGGNDNIRVTDDGSGMNRDDVDQCYLPHATSKIASDEDLLRLETLGFRGEALSSMAAVSRLSITSLDRSGEEGTTAHRVEVHGGKLIASGPAPGPPGTTVDVANLFFNVPARKQFLKRAQSEFALARSVLIDKALAFPDVTFRLFSGTELRLFLPAGERHDRITAAYPERTEPALLHTLTGSGDGFSFQLVAGEPQAARRDRKHVQIFVNRRRIWEYALVQAIEYAYREHLYGGLFPVGYLFLDVEPSLVDFNIHPAKREARFRNLPDIHRRVVEVLGSYLHAFDRSAAQAAASPAFPGMSEESEVTDRTGPDRSQAAFPTPSGPTDNGETGYRATAHYSAPRAGNASRGVIMSRSTHANVAYDLSRSLELPRSDEFRYLGQVFGLFLVVERDDRLFLVDQHAAHERIIYDRLRDGSAGQDLLFPIRFDTEADDGDTLAEHLDELSRLGIELHRTGDETWELASVPASIRIPSEELVEMIRELSGRPEDFSRELYASMSCRSAVMDGDIISAATAHTIIADSLGLANARCPHGRPIWIEFSREQLMRLVGRI